MRIYVGNLPYSVGDDELRDLFSPFGDVKDAKVIWDRTLDKSKGFGFVEMPSNGEAQAAIDKLNGAEAGEAGRGRKLTVNEARPRTERRF